jgi:hypothetical protein
LSESEIHSGYPFEEGMFARMRCWVDVAPWARLARVPRLIASPSYVGLVTVTVGLSRLCYRGCFRPAPQPDSPAEPAPSATLLGWPSAPPTLPEGEIAAVAVFAVLMWILWTPLIQLVARGGASLTAGRGLPSLVTAARALRQRWWMSYLVPLVPWVGAVLLGLGLWLLRLPNLALQPVWVSVGTGWLLGLATLPLGILCFGAAAAIPLGLVAMACEPDPDPIDSLSRGYEYLFRRPLSLVWLALVSTVLSAVAAILLGGLCAVWRWGAVRLSMAWIADAV